MSTKFSSYGISQTYSNGQKVADLSYNATYDGKHANIAASDGNIKTFVRLSNEDIENLMNNKNTSREALHDKISKLSKTRSRAKSPGKKKTRRRSVTKSKTARRKKRYMKKGKHSKTKRVGRKSIPAIDREIIW